MALQFTTRQIKDAAITAAKIDLTGTFDYSSGVLRAAAPSASSDVATKSYVDNASAGLYWKDAARVATTANITLSGTQTIDGVGVQAGDRVLVKDQSSAPENGIYVAAAGAWSRAADMDAGTEFAGAALFVMEGTAQADTAWVCTNDGSVNVGTTDVAFVQFAGNGSVVGGDGISVTGKTVAVDLATNPGLEFNSAALRVKLNGVNPGLALDGAGLAVLVKNNAGLGKDANGLLVNTLNGVQVDGSGNVTLRLDGSTLAQGASGVKIADGGVDSAQIAADAVTLAEAGFRPFVDGFTGNGSTAAYDLAQDIRSQFYNGVLVMVNGQIAKQVASSPADATEYAVDRNGSTNKTRITFGANLDSGDEVQARYLG